MLSRDTQCHSLVYNCLSLQPTLCLKKLPTLSLSISSSNIKPIFNFFTDALGGQFAKKRLLNIPPHLNCVATLTCEIQIFRTHYNLNKYVCKNIFRDSSLLMFILKLNYDVLKSISGVYK